ncbi:MAG: hypothetical protein AAFU03_08740, partial [Bacteroidota bacterium]
MRKALPTFLSALVSLSLFGQITLTSDYIPAVGDTLFQSVADSNATVDLIGPGGPFEWDFSNLTADNTFEQLVLAPDPQTIDSAFSAANLKIEFNAFSTNYYDRSDAEFNLIGNVGSNDLLSSLIVETPFNPPYRERRAPLNYLDEQPSTSSVIVALAVDSLPQEILDIGGPTLTAFDSIRLNTDITRLDVVDAYGRLTVDGAIYDVLRERREEYRDIRIEARLGLFPWTDVTATLLAFVPDLADAAADQDTIISYNFWNNNSIEPIAIVSTSDGETIRSITFKTNRQTSSTDDDYFPSYASITMYPNPARSMATFEATGLQRGEYTLKVHNIVGRRLFSQNFSSTGSIKADIEVNSL